MFFDKKVIFSILGGYVLGKTGSTILGSKTAKKGYLKAATGAYILKDSIMEKAEIIQAEASDIAADARAEADRYQADKDAAFMAFLKNASVCADSIDSEADPETDSMADSEEIATAE